MKLSKELLFDVARLSRVNISNEETDQFLDELNDVVKAFDLLSEVDTKGVSPSLHPVKITPKLREDKPEVKKKTALFGEMEDGYFVGPSLK